MRLRGGGVTRGWNRWTLRNIFNVITSIVFCLFYRCYHQCSVHRREMLRSARGTSVERIRVDVDNRQVSRARGNRGSHNLRAGKHIDGQRKRQTPSNVGRPWIFLSVEIMTFVSRQLYDTYCSMGTFLNLMQLYLEKDLTNVARDVVEFNIVEDVLVKVTQRCVSVLSRNTDDIWWRPF